MSLKSLPVEKLYQYCDLTTFRFESTAELAPLEEFFGQDRALEALNFGVGIKQKGFNLFVLGPTGVGKHTLVKKFLKQEASKQATPSDWCYVNNFAKAHKPQVLKLTAGKGRELRQDMRQLIEDLRTGISVAFEAKAYHEHVLEIEDHLKNQVEEAFTRLAEEATTQEIQLARTASGFIFSPTKNDKVIQDKEFNKLSDEEQKAIQDKIDALQQKLSTLIRQQPTWQREARKKVKKLNAEVALLASGGLIDDLKKKYADFPEAITYFEAVQQDVLDHIKEFRGQEQEEAVPPPLPSMMDTGSFFRRYDVNIFVDHSDTTGAPVVYEDSPQYQNLVGRIEYFSQMGTLQTDFALIKPGALHTANGGYLILDAAKILNEPYAWEGLKRALYAQEVRIQSLGQIYSMVNTVSLEPEATPLNLKVVLVGERMLYYLLQDYDPEFAELFKVAADFESEIDRTDENNQLYAQLIGTIAQKEDLLPFDRSGVARIIEHSSRLVEDTAKLSTHILTMADLIRESDYWAKQAGRTIVASDDVQSAIDKQIHRVSRLRDQIHEQIERGSILIDTAGSTVGQINALSVIDLGNFAFAQPSRVTANVSLGEGDIVNIEREVELSGAIHSKGVMILASYLGTRYSKNQPLSLSASLAFEQSYGEIDGDSATITELCALLSAIANVPLRQDLAITGSVDQHGQIQPIGGVNEKIEGFFDICQTRGLSGTQGVIIPEKNVNDLMLKQAVRDAAAEGKFHIYAVTTVDDVTALLTGMPAGEADAQGKFPEESFNHNVAARLAELAELRHEFGKPSSDSDSDDKEEKSEDAEDSEENDDAPTIRLSNKTSL